MKTAGCGKGRCSFLKKRTKKLLPVTPDISASQPREQRFLASFFKKEVLAFLLIL
jgi:hypothetical protein